MKRRSWIRSLPTAMLLVVAIACGGDDPEAEPAPTATGPTTAPPTVTPTSTGTPDGRTGRTVNVIDNSYVPQELTVTAGTEVIWIYVGPDAPHTVTSVDGVFDSHPECPPDLSACMGSGETFRHTFPEPGTFIYNCKVHRALMGGSIVVTE